MYLRGVLPFGRTTIPIDDVPPCWRLGEPAEDEFDDPVADPHSFFSMGSSFRFQHHA